MFRSKLFNAAPFYNSLYIVSAVLCIVTVVPTVHPMKIILFFVLFFSSFGYIMYVSAVMSTIVKNKQAVNIHHSMLVMP